VLLVPWAVLDELVEAVELVAPVVSVVGEVVAAVVWSVVLEVEAVELGVVEDVDCCCGYVVSVVLAVEEDGVVEDVEVEALIPVEEVELDGSVLVLVLELVDGEELVVVLP